MRWMNNKVLLYTTGKYTQYPVITVTLLYSRNLHNTVYKLYYNKNF